MTWNALTEKEKNILFKLIIRYHKENGFFSTFVQYKDNRKNSILKRKSNNEVYESLISYIWQVYKKQNGNTSETDILASIYYLGFIGYIEEYNVFENLKKDIAYSEFKYIESCLRESYSLTPPMYITKQINEVWNKYSLYVSKTLFSELPIKIDK